MFSVVVYGSLIDRRELSQQIGEASAPIPVTVSGFRRVFNQEPVWRSRSGDDRAVLNVLPSAQHVFNGVLVTVRSDEHLAGLDNRERGYDRVRLAPSRLAAFFGGNLPIHAGEVYIYVGKSALRNERLSPHPEYLQQFMAAAHCWGGPFFSQALRTTYLADACGEDGKSLAILPNRPARPR